MDCMDQVVVAERMKPARLVADARMLAYTEKI
jgi:hypothetical protein